MLAGTQIKKLILSLLKGFFHYYEFKTKNLFFFSFNTKLNLI